MNTSSAQLPSEIGKFKGLENVKEISERAQKVFLSILLVCVYSLLTVAITTDASLLRNSASSPLPIIQVEIPIAGAYWLAPLLLACFYGYLRIYLHRLWQGLSELPAVFPEGRS